MKVPNQRQFDFIHNVTRNARMDGMAKADFISWVAAAWDAQVNAEKLERAELSQADSANDNGTES